MVKRNITQLRKTNYEIFIVILTFLSWLNIPLYFFMQDMNAKKIIFNIEFLLTLIFLADFLLRLRTAQSARSYFFKEFGWLDLLGSLPFFRFLRIHRVYKTIQRIETFGNQRLVREFFSNRAETAALTVALAILLLFEFATLAILWTESGVENANITTANDATWWVLVTVATIGYGDLYPVTDQGRFVAMFVIVAGVGLFGVISGFLARNFLGQDVNSAMVSTVDNPAAKELTHILAELKQIRHDQEQTRNKVEKERLERAVANEQIAERLAALEQLLERSKE